MAKNQSQLSDIQISYDDILMFDEDAFHDLLNKAGVTFLHYRAIKCPIGTVDQYDGRRPHSDHSSCSNGFIYNLAGQITCVFSSNKLQTRLVDLGLFNESSAVLTIPTTYDNSEEPVYVFPYDRLFIKDYHTQVVNTEEIEYNATGIDRLQFPAVKVQDLIDSHGRQYYENQDFVLEQGNIKWLPNHGPGVDIKNEHGVIYGIRYLYIPFWYIQLIFNEIRVIKGSNFITGNTTLLRKPMNILIQREYIYHNEDNKSSRLSINSARQAFAPPSNGIFSPR